MSTNYEMYSLFRGRFLIHREDEGGEEEEKNERILCSSVFTKCFQFFKQPGKRMHHIYIPYSRPHTGLQKYFIRYGKCPANTSNNWP